MTSGWTIDNGQAVFERGGHRLAFELARPQLGFRYNREGVDLPQALRIELPGQHDCESVAECYVRCDDLVVTYEQRATRTVQPQIRIHVVEASGDFVLQLILSMQTNLLESDPSTKVISEFGGGDLKTRCGDAWHSAVESPTLSPSGFLHRQTDSGCSFFQLLHPSDIVARAEQLNPLRAEFHLLSESLEKGVIRRARIMAGWTDSENDLETAERYSGQLAKEAPPLAT